MEQRKLALCNDDELVAQLSCEIACAECGEHRLYITEPLKLKSGNGAFFLNAVFEYQVGNRSVVGEIGSCKPAGSGHIYFTLKDSTAQLQCVLYRYQALGCRVRLQEGLRVELTGRATVWEGRGSLQFVVSSVKAAGQGDLQQQFLELKRRLEAEGLFAPERKQRIPAFPQSVGLITSPTGAVIEDMRHRLSSRSPWMQVYLYPV